MSILSYTLIGIGVLILILISFLILMLLYFVFKNNFKKEILLEELSSDIRKSFYDEKKTSKIILGNSDWSNIKGAYKYKEPTVLIQFYNSNEVLAKNFYYFVIDNKTKKQNKWFINNFIPSANAINNGYFTFAEDGMGNFYFIKLLENRDNDYAVFLCDHETEEISMIANSLKKFLDSKRLVIV